MPSEKIHDLHICYSQIRRGMAYDRLTEFRLWPAASDKRRAANARTVLIYPEAGDVSDLREAFDQNNLKLYAAEPGASTYCLFGRYSIHSNGVVCKGVVVELPVEQRGLAVKLMMRFGR